MLRCIDWKILTDVSKVSTYQSTRLNILESLNLQQYCREYLEKHNTVSTSEKTHLFATST